VQIKALRDFKRQTIRKKTCNGILLEKKEPRKILEVFLEEDDKDYISCIANWINEYIPPIMRQS
jgi:hypothetical protein